MNEAERLGNMLIQKGWPKSKEAAPPYKAATEAAQAAVEQEAKLRHVKRIAREIETVASFPWHPIEKRLEMIRECVERLNHLLKGTQ